MTDHPSRKKCKTCKRHLRIDQHFFRCLEHKEEYTYALRAPCSEYSFRTPVRNTPKPKTRKHVTNENRLAINSECVTCEGYRPLDDQKFYCLTRDMAIFDDIGLTCSGSYNPIQEKKMTEPKPTKHFHRWEKKSGNYCGAVQTATGELPVNSAYDYEEYEPPPRKDPDGWYVIRHRANGSLRQFARKDGPTVRDIIGKVISEYWCDYDVLARIPHVEWVVDEEENKA